MQGQFPQNPDFMEHFISLKEHMPFIDEVMDTDFSANLYQTDQSLISNILQKCLTEIKEQKTIIASQEDVLQSATEELISLREENGHLNETNNNLTNQIVELKHFLNEADTIAINLRSEMTQLKQDNRILIDACKHLDLPSRDDSLRMLSEPTEHIIVTEKEVETVSDILTEQDIRQNSFNEIIQQKESLIRSLNQNIQDLLVYKEKCDHLLQENQDFRVYKEQNKNLTEELFVLREENKKLSSKGSEEILKKLSQYDAMENPDQEQITQVEREMIWSFVNSKDEEGQNKNLLARKPYAMASSPSKENVDIKKQNLLMETLLLNSSKGPNTPLQKGQDNRKKPVSLRQHLKNLKVLNGGSLLKSNTKVVASSLGEALSKGMEFECDDKRSKVEKGIAPLRINADGRNSPRQISARKFEDRAHFRELSSDINTSKTSDDHCFDEMLSWDEGDFPRLNCSNIVCNSPNVEFVLEDHKAHLANKDVNADEAISKDLMIKPVISSINLDQSIIHKEESGAVEKENKISSPLKNPENMKKALHKNTEKEKDYQKKLQVELANKLGARHLDVQEISTQTDAIEYQSGGGSSSSQVKQGSALRINIWNGLALLVSLLFSLMLISIFY